MIQYGNSFFASVGVFTYPLHTSILGKNLDEGTPMFFAIENQQAVLTDAPTTRYAGILRLRQATGEWAVSRKEYVADENGKIALTLPSPLARISRRCWWPMTARALRLIPLT